MGLLEVMLKKCIFLFWCNPPLTFARIAISNQVKRTFHILAKTYCFRYIDNEQVVFRHENNPIESKRSQTQSAILCVTFVSGWCKPIYSMATHYLGDFDDFFQLWKGALGWKEVERLIGKDGFFDRATKYFICWRFLIWLVWKCTQFIESCSFHFISLIQNSRIC